MSDKADRSRPTISLPQGGGAIRSLGETFSPDLFTGTGNFTVPITLPPGRNGFQPAIQLSYSTGNGNSPFGLGWALSAPAIARKTSKGVPTYGNADVFILAGAEDLVRLPPRPGAPTLERYRPRTESAFASIERTIDGANDFWEIRNTNGNVSLYGTPATRGGDPAVIARTGGNRRQAFSWKLSQTRDPFGNIIEYTYDRDAAAGGTREWDQLYLSRIRYVDDVPPGGTRRFSVTVSFLYEDRTDAFSEYRAGFEIRTRRRCTTIRVSTDVGQVVRVRDYELAYTNAPSNDASLLASVTVAGYGAPDANGDQVVERMPPVAFEYTTFQPEARRFVPLSGSLPTESLLNPNYELVDLRGTGLPDILQIEDTIRYWRNRGHGAFDPPRLMRSAPAGLALSQPGVQLVDADGDGRTDLLLSTPDASGFFPITTEGTWDERVFTRYHSTPTFALDDPNVRLIDLDGDGVIDALRSGTRLECFFNARGAGWQDTLQVARQTLDRFPNVAFSDPRVRIADMTGDGLQDIVFLHDRSVEYWPNLGHGRWAARVRMTGSPHFPLGFDPKRVLLGDVDGDGVADIVYIDDREVRVWINQNGNGFQSAPTVIRGTPPVTDLDSVRLADMFGAGTAGVLWSADASTLKRKAFWFLDLTGGRKPYLLGTMTNNLGATTRVQYTSSTEERLRDEASPLTRWRTPLPFPVHVVSRVEVIDELSGGKLTTRYRYHQGYWDGVEREFRGFGMVEQFDTESFDDYHEAGLADDATAFQPLTHAQFSPPTLVKTWFHQGAIARPNGDWRESDDPPDAWPDDPPVFEQKSRVDQFLDGLDAGALALTRQARRDALRALRGHALRTELYALDGDPALQDRPYTVTERTYELVEIEPPSAADPPRQRIFFPHEIASRTTQWERGGDPMTSFALTRYDTPDQAGWTFDPFGRVRAQTTVAMPRRSLRRHARPFDETRVLATYTTTAYAESPDASVFIHDRVADTRSYELSEAPGLTETDPASVVSLLRDQAAAAGAVADLFDEAVPGTLRLFAHTMYHYDGQPFEGLPTGELGTLGAPARTETLVFGEEELAVYGDRRPDYLGGTLARPAGPPADTAAGLGYHVANTPLGVPAYYVNTVSRTQNPQGLPVRWRDPFGAETQAIYDGRSWLLTSLVDPLGNGTVVVNDYRVCQPALMTDANGNQTRVSFSPVGLPIDVWALGQPGRSEGSRSRPVAAFEYDFFAFMNSAPANRQPAMTRTIRYLRDDTDTTASSDERQETLESREYSDGFGRSIQLRARAEDVIFGDSRFGGGDDVLSPSAATSATADVIGVRNGNPAEPNVVISGWQTFDNKGRVVEKYESSFAKGWAYGRPAPADRGRRITMLRDSLGRVTRTINPDGSEERVLFGVPATLDTPESIAPTPWETYVYDANDLATLSHDPSRVLPDGTPATLEDLAPASHRFTPSSGLVDALGRRLVDCHRNGPVPATDWFVTRTEYDIRGNVLTVVDPLGRVSLAYAYDLTNQPLREQPLDGGVRTTVRDALGAVVETRDDKAALVVNRYDAGRRLVSVWARDNGTRSVTERQRLEFIDTSSLRGFTLDDARANNGLGRLWRHYDEAGMVQCERRDLRGNLVERTRSVVSDQAIASGWIAAWNAPDADAVIDDISYTTTLAFDALNRQISFTCPNPTGAPAVFGPRYNRAGALQSITMNGAPVVRDIVYNAKAQRILVHLGNGLLTRYAYDPLSFRLRRLRTEPADVAGDTYSPVASVVQDTFYEYDLVGNLVRAIDRAPASGVRNNPDSIFWTDVDPGLATDIATGDALVREFACDALYRLTSASGREGLSVPEPRPWADYGNDGYLAAGAAAPDPFSAPDVTARYVEQYAYDPAGNLLSLRHSRSGDPTWVRQFGMGGLSATAWDQAWRAQLNALTRWVNAPGNQLTHVGDDQVPVPATHQFDPAGNLIQEQVDRRFVWNYANELVQFLVQPTPVATPSVDARYLYGADGARVKKWVRRNGVAISDESRVYIDGVLEHQRWTENGAALQNTLVHVMDTQSRIATKRSGPSHPDDAGPAVQYHIGDHLGSSHVVVGGTGVGDADFINKEEYLPYGETSFGSFGRKRFRFTGRERDEESGLHYHRARFYAPWLCRWLSTDPAGPVDGLNLYLYCRGNPVVLRDPGGLDSDVNGTPASASQAAQSSSSTFEKSPVAGYTSSGAGGTSTGPAPSPAQASQPAAQPPAPRPAPVAPAPPPAALPPTPAVKQTDAKGAQEIASMVAVWNGEPKSTLDETKYLETWKHPAMNDILDGLSSQKAEEFRSKIDPKTIATLNAVPSPSLRPMTTASMAGMAWELSCISPIVGDECKAATYPSYPDGSLVMENPDNFVSNRKKATGKEVTNNIFDAFGHCFDGCRVAQSCGPKQALMWGREREAWREAGFGGAHDSLVQDCHNEARGVLIYLSHPEGVDCAAACAAAVDTLLDLTAPAVHTR